MVALIPRLLVRLLVRAARACFRRPLVAAFAAAAAALFWLLAGLSLPVARDAAGRPDLTGLWAGPPLVVAESSGPSAHAPAAAREADRAARTSASFAAPGWRALLGPTVLRRRPSADVRLMHPAAAVRLRRRDAARRARGEADSWLDRNTWERCITRGLPPAALPEAHADRWFILQTPRVVAIVTEALHEHRIAVVGGRPAPVPAGWLGASTARWAGDVLILETDRFRHDLDGGDVAPASPIPAQHRGSGAGLRVVERLRASSRDRIEVEVEVLDPAVYLRPLVYGFTLRREPAASLLYESACHEGNRSMSGILAGGRVDELRSLQASRAGVDARAAAGHPGVIAPALPFWQPSAP